MNIADTQLELRSYPGEIRTHQHDQYHQLVLPCEGVLEMQVGSREGLVGLMLWRSWLPARAMPLPLGGAIVFWWLTCQ